MVLPSGFIEEFRGTFRIVRQRLDVGIEISRAGIEERHADFAQARRIPSMIFCRSTSIVMAWRTLLSLKNGRSLFHMMAASVGMEYFTFANCCSNAEPPVCSEIGRAHV